MNVKKERNASNAKLKSLETELDDLKQHLTKKSQNIKVLENDVIKRNEALKAKDNECENLIKGKIELEKRLKDSLLELVVVKEESIKEVNTVKFRCSLCDLKYESAVELSAHVREYHYKDQVSQTKTTTVEISTQTGEKDETLTFGYPCFYCGHIIRNLESLQNPQIECHESGPLFHDSNFIEKATYFHPLLLPSFAFPPPFLLPLEVSCYTCSTTNVN